MKIFICMDENILDFLKNNITLSNILKPIF